MVAAPAGDQGLDGFHVPGDGGFPGCRRLSVSQFSGVVAELPPVRSGGIYATDTKTDKCIDNLWRSIQEWQQRKKGAGAPPVCPASGRPYVVVPGTDPEIHCPDPGRHGFRDIVVSTSRPVPELKR